MMGTACGNSVIHGEAQRRKGRVLASSGSYPQVDVVDDSIELIGTLAYCPIRPCLAADAEPRCWLIHFDVSSSSLCDPAPFLASLEVAQNNSHGGSVATAVDRVPCSRLNRLA